MPPSRSLAILLAASSVAAPSLAGDRTYFSTNQTTVTPAQPAAPLPNAATIRAAPSMTPAALLTPAASLPGADGETPLTSDEALGLPPKDFTAGCLVLHDGRTFTGKITSVPGGYQAETTRGRMILPYDQVRLTAANVQEAYEKQRENHVNANASERQDLARWCFEQKLYTEARTECLQAIRMEPQRSDLRQLLLKIDSATNQVNAATALPLLPVPSNETRSVLGLTQRTNADFIRQVQPLLMNSCGNAACHGAASDREFKLLPVFPGRGSQKYQSQHNLEQVLKYLDTQAPESSPLLSIPRDKKHSPVHSNVYAGRKGLDQYELLKAWAIRACGERTSAGTKGEAAPRSVTQDAPPTRRQSLVLEPRATAEPGLDGKRLSGAGVEPAAFSTGRGEPADEPAAASAPRTTEPTGAIPRTISDSELLEGVRRAAKPDPFDPREFNEKMGLIRPTSP